jgi:phosphoserine phosphatase
MNNTLFLVRHGEVEYPLDAEGRRCVYGPDVSLSDEGRQQIAHTAQSLLQQTERPARIFSSPYPRAVESAHIIQETLSISSIEIVEGLKDVVAPGYAGMPYDELMAVGGNIYDMPPRTPDQETLQKLAERSWKALNDVLQRTGAETPLIVSHGDTLRVLMHRLRYGAGLPNPNTMRDEDYLEKGHAFRAHVDPSLHLLDLIDISREARPSKPENRF